MNSSVTAKNIPTLTSVSSAGDAAARPKIMRRPAQFSTASQMIIVQAPALNNTIELPKPTPTNAPKLWQDDGRFAIALVVVLVAINLLASTWLAPPAPPAKPVPAPTYSATPAAVTILNELNPPESNQ